MLKNEWGSQLQVLLPQYEIQVFFWEGRRLVVRAGMPNSHKAFGFKQGDDLKTVTRRLTHAHEWSDKC